MTSTVEPKHTSHELKPLANTFATMVGTEFHYFGIKLGERKGNFVELLQNPPMIADGFVTFERKLYRVNKTDIFKGKVNVSSPVDAGPESKPTTIHEPGTEQSGSSKPETVEPVTVTDSNESGIDGYFRLSVDEDVDLAWTEQIGTLLRIEDPEADWEPVPDAA